jgi:hypothetical protein
MRRIFRDCVLFLVVVICLLVYGVILVIKKFGFLKDFDLMTGQSERIAEAEECWAELK